MDSKLSINTSKHVSTSQDVWETINMLENCMENLDPLTGYFVCRYLREYAIKLEAVTHQNVESVKSKLPHA